ncbi:MAG TPA: hypothetical protein VIM39_04875, partial [Candidatus Limnocylindrales bacterium]
MPAKRPGAAPPAGKSTDALVETDDSADAADVGESPDPPAAEVAHADLHADEAADLADDLTNGDLARIFHEIGDILEVKGEL